MSEVIVLGAGPAGLGAALALGEAATVLEARPDVAGLCRTLEFDGAIFDLGGHSFHTPHPEVRDLVFSTLEMEEQVRDAWVWLSGDWVRYPFQKHYDDLSSPEIRRLCRDGLAGRDDCTAAADFDEHISLRFGDGIASHFMRPYNRKLWGQDLQRLEVDWTAERVAGPASGQDAFATVGGQRKPLQADTRVAYPARGGFGEIFLALSRRVRHLRLGQRAVEIDPARRRLATQAGERFGWRKLVSTLPLPHLLRLIRGVPEELLAAVARLEALPVSLFMVTLDQRISGSRHRVYNPAADMPGHKIVLNNTSSDWLRARPRHGVQVEISDTGGGEINHAAILAGLRRMGIIDVGDDVVATNLLRLPLGYPVPTHGRRGIVAEAKAWLARHDIFTVGRFAEWAYINADEALFRGMTLGRALAGVA